MDPELGRKPQPAEEQYRYAPDGNGERRVDDVFKTPGDVVDLGELARQRKVNPLEQDLGPIMIVTRSPGPVTEEGRPETRMYAVTSELALNTQTGDTVAIDPLDATQMQPVTIGRQWQSPFGKPTKYPVLFVARPHSNGYLPTEIDAAHDKPAVQATTVIGQQQLMQVLGAGGHWG